LLNCIWLIKPVIIELMDNFFFFFFEISIFFYSLVYYMSYICFSTKPCTLGSAASTPAPSASSTFPAMVMVVVAMVVVAMVVAVVVAMVMAVVVAVVIPLSIEILGVKVLGIDVLGVKVLGIDVLGCIVLSGRIQITPKDHERSRGRDHGSKHMTRGQGSERGERKRGKRNKS